MTFKCFCGREYLHFPDLLDHHFHEHEKPLPKEAIERTKNTRSIGYPNTKTWTNIYGELI